MSISGQNGTQLGQEPNLEPPEYKSVANRSDTKHTAVEQHKHCQRAVQ